MDESILSTKLRLANIEAQVASHFPEWKEHVRATVGQIKVADTSVKTLQQELIELTNLYTKYNYKLGMIFRSISSFKSSIQKSIQTVTKRAYRIEAFTLVVTTTRTSLPEQKIL